MTITVIIRCPRGRVVEAVRAAEAGYVIVGQSPPRPTFNAAEPDEVSVRLRVRIRAS